MELMVEVLRVKILKSAKTSDPAALRPPAGCPLRRLELIMKFYELKRRKPSREKDTARCSEEVASGRGLEPEQVGSSEGCCDSSSDEAEPGRKITGFGFSFNHISYHR